MRRYDAASAVRLFLVLILCAGPALHAQEARGSAKASSRFERGNTTADALKEAAAPRRLVLLVGARAYEDPAFPDLQFADADARVLAQVLRKEPLSEHDQVIELTTPAQTRRQAIFAQLRDLVKLARKEDTLILYFSGHGTRELELGGEARLYLVPSDADASKLATSAIDLREFEQYFWSLAPSQKLLILDNCFSGNGKSRLAPDTLERLRAEASAKSEPKTGQNAEAMLMASRIGGTAHEDPQLRHGTYTYFLIEALTRQRAKADANGDQAISAWEAHDFARVLTMEHGGAAHTAGGGPKSQTPEGFFHVLGRNDVYLTAPPDPRMARATALIYAYGSDKNQGHKVRIDRVEKGAFPRTIPVDAGAHHIEVRDERDHVIAAGRLELVAGQIYSAGLLIEELQGYRRFFGIKTGGLAQLTGSGIDLWGPLHARVAVLSGYRMRGGRWRGLTLSGEAGWNAAWEGQWQETSSQPFRSLFDVTLQAMMRRSIGQMQVGAGVHAGARLVLGVEPAARLEQGDNRLRPWVSFPAGPLLWQGIPLDKQMLLTLEQRASAFIGDFREDGSDVLNVQLSLQVGLELGF